MRLLLDTHVLIWALVDDARLTAAARGMIRDESNRIFVSVASIWEIAIKFSLRRGGGDSIPLSSGDALEGVDIAGFSMLPISTAHVRAVEQLPLLHGDPFDRLLVAQAIEESMTLLTRDRQLAGYGGVVTCV